MYFEYFEKEKISDGDGYYINEKKAKINRLIDQCINLDRNMHYYLSIYNSKKKDFDDCEHYVEILEKQIESLKDTEKLFSTTISNLQDDIKKLQTTLDFTKDFNKSLPTKIKEIKDKMTARTI